MSRSEINEEEVARHWDGNADLWTQQVRKGFDAYRELINNPAFLRSIGNLNGKRILDAGCGEGYNTRTLAGRGAQVVGVDISQRMIKLAREAEQKEPLGIRYEVAPFSNLSLFEDASFDIVVSTMALMDSPDYEGALKEFFRVLRRKGRLFFSITHPCFMTKGYGWVQDEQGNAIEITASNYFDHQPWVEHWRFAQGPQDVEPFAVPQFPRTLSDYFNALIKAGFILKKIQEPRPSQRVSKKHPWLQKWRDHAAIFLHVHAAKP